LQACGISIFACTQHKAEHQEPEGAHQGVGESLHTIWGVIAGNLLMKDWPHRKKISIMLAVGLVGTVAGYAMSTIIPIIKRLCPSSFIIVGGGRHTVEGVNCSSRGRWARSMARKVDIGSTESEVNSCDPEWFLESACRVGLSRQFPLTAE
jgi:hypothetical protein